MNSSQVSSELRRAVAALRPFFVRSAWFSLFASLLVLAPSGYMLEVYDRVVTSRSHVTLLWLTVLVLGAFLLMEVLEWARSEVMRRAAEALDEQLHMRVFQAMFEANVRRVPGGHVQSLSDFRRVCEFLYSPALLAILEAPIALVMMVLLFLISPVLGWSAVAFAILQTAVAWFNERSTQPPLMAVVSRLSSGVSPNKRSDSKPRGGSAVGSGATNNKPHNTPCTTTARRNRSPSTALTTTAPAGATARNQPACAAAARSRIWSPMATPTRGWGAAAVLKMP